VPNASQWRRESVYLPNVAGVGHLQAAFIGVGRNGNNLYLDNIAVRPAVGVLPAFDAGVRKVCPGQSIQFINKSQIFGNPGPVSWSWTFEGGSPGSSTAESPAGISFAQPGRYDVTLSGTVGGVTYTTTLEDFVTVLDIAELAPTFSESFDQAGVLDTDEWLASPRNAWVEVALGTLPGGASVAVDHYNNDYSTTELRLLTPNIGFHGLENAYLQFDVAYSGWISPNGTTLIYDDLELLYSTDCGATFTSFRTFLGAELATAAATSQLFVPTSSQWRTISVPLYGVNASGQLEGLRFAIRPLGGYGNVLWLDNVVAEAFGSEAPVADFFTSAYPQPADVGTVLVNQPVQFVERSRYFPQFWTWSFEGGSPSVSNERNPSVVFAEPGTYNVSLTVSSPFGVGVATRSAYVVVASPSGGQSTELDNGTDGVESVDASDEYGYVSGHNNYEDAAVAEYFADPSPFAEMTEAKFWFLEALAGNRQPVQVRVWANDAGKPGAVLASETIPFASVQASATGGTPVRVPFSQPVQVAGGFFVGILLNYSAGGDQVALRTDEVEENTAWTLYSDNTWHEFSETGNWDISRSLWIFPTVRVATVTALEDEPLSQGLVLYPNPTGGLVSWKAVPGAVATGYEVLDLVGRRVAAGTPTLEGGLQQADLGGLPSGVYLLRLETPQGQALKKVVLSR
jgi:PKD repeat protein